MDWNIDGDDQYLKKKIIQKMAEMHRKFRVALTKHVNAGTKHSKTSRTIVKTSGRFN